MYAQSTARVEYGNASVNENGLGGTVTVSLSRAIGGGAPRRPPPREGGTIARRSDASSSSASSVAVVFEFKFKFKFKFKRSIARKNAPAASIARASRNVAVNASKSVDAVAAPRESPTAANALAAVAAARRRHARWIVPAAAAAAAVAFEFERPE
jgi:hypothetical protein